MRVPVTATLVSLLLAGAACAPRQVEVRTAPPSTSRSELAVLLSNSLSQAVNVYVTAPGSGELFLKQVAANTVETLPVQGIASGTNVTFKAVTVDGSRTYQSRSVALSAPFAWTIP
jgi:hypothetical protein